MVERPRRDPLRPARPLKEVSDMMKRECLSQGGCPRCGVDAYPTFEKSKSLGNGKRSRKLFQDCATRHIRELKPASYRSRAPEEYSTSTRLRGSLTSREQDGRTNESAAKTDFDLDACREAVDRKVIPLNRSCK